MKKHVSIASVLISFLLLTHFFSFCTASVSSGEEIGWFIVKLSGTPVGLMRECKRIDERGFFYEAHMDATVSRMGTELRIVIDEVEEDEVDGRLKNFVLEFHAGSWSMKTSGERKGDTLNIEFSSQLAADLKKLQWEEGAVGNAYLDYLVAERLKEGDTNFSVRFFSNEKGGFETMTIESRGRKKEKIKEDYEGLLIVAHLLGENEVEVALSYLDDDFRPVKIVLPVGGLEMVLEAATEEEVNSTTFTTGFDIVKRSMIPCPGLPESAGCIEDVSFKIVFKTTPKKEPDLQGPNQIVSWREDDSLGLLVTRETVFKETLGSDSAGEFLEPDLYIQSDHPMIKAVADSIVAANMEREVKKLIDETSGDVSDEAPGWVLAREIAQWVNRHIINKNLEKGFASAAEALEAKSGDCTEHAVLLAALLRAAGIPARLAGGLAYADGYLLGHMWTEAYVHYWRTIDATDSSFDPTKIKFFTSYGKGMLYHTDLFEACAIMGNIEVEVTEFNEMGKK